jgi:hypothetical protein
MVILIPMLYIGFLYVSYVDKEVTAGDAYGFTIGQTKADVYRIARSKFQQGHITEIHTIRNREEEIKRFTEINGDDNYRTVAEVRGWFDRWNHWSLWLDGENRVLLAIVTFHGNRVSDVYHPTDGEVGEFADADGVPLKLGQTYSEAYEALESLSRTAGYETLVVRSGWMARRQPVEFQDSEYRFVEEFDEWTLLVSKRSFMNFIRLTFENGRLSRIYRHRKYFEGT